MDSDFKGLIVKAAAAVVLLFSVLILPFNLVENVASDEIVAIQSLGGGLKFVTTPGPAGQWLGRVTSYPKRSQYEFEHQVRFNDGGHGTMKGSVQWEMPTDRNSLYNLHTKFGSAEAIASQLIEKSVNKAIYMTGPLMSSKESYAEKRNYLINYVQDQIDNGVFRTAQREVEQTDQLTQQKKTTVVVEVLNGPNGQPLRQEAPPLAEFSIRTFNFAIAELKYDERVEKQIEQQQQITMDVQTAIANARKAEQDRITTEQRGQANAAEAKWQQEVVKAKEVTAAQQRLEVASLATKEAEQYKQAALLKAEGDAGYRKKMMEADNALQQRLDAAIKINGAYAEAIKGYGGNIVPGVVMGGGDKSAGGISDLISLLVAQTATQVGLKKEQ